MKRQSPSRALWIAVACLAILASSRANDAVAQTAARPELYFVAVGAVPDEMMQRLVAHFRSRFAIPIKTLLPLSFDEATFDPRRKQVVADRVIDAIRMRNATLAKNRHIRVIAITPDDMYMLAMRVQWSFTFSLRSADHRFAVISYARMDPVNLGDPRNDELLLSRLRKMIAKNIGIMYYRLPVSSNPRSVLFRNVLGVDELDRMTEDFNPK